MWISRRKYPKTYSQKSPRYASNQVARYSSSRRHNIYKPCIKYMPQACVITSMLCIKTVYQGYSSRISHIIHDMPQPCTKMYASNHAPNIYQNMSQACTKISNMCINHKPWFPKYMSNQMPKITNICLYPFVKDPPIYASSNRP
jgi:hypothetical protein